MERIEIGTSGIMTSRIGLGTWAIGGMMWGGVDEAQAIATIQQAVASGVTLIDTAAVYGFGLSEEIVGKALKQAGIRDKAQIATKAGLSWSDRGVFRDARASRIRQEVEDSLRRLQTDVIDLYQVHWPDLETPFEETACELERLRVAGKIRAVGVSNFSPAQMDTFRQFTKIDAIQPPYNLLERDMENDVLPYSVETGLTVLSYGAICRGLLSGKITTDTVFNGDDLRKFDPKFLGERLTHNLAAVAALEVLARERFNKSVLALAVRWVLDKGPTIALWGARTPSQLDQVSDISGWTIDAATMQEIDAILNKHVPDPISPAFMAPPTKRP